MLPLLEAGHLCFTATGPPYGLAGRLQPPTIGLMTFDRRLSTALGGSRQIRTFSPPRRNDDIWSTAAASDRRIVGQSCRSGVVDRTAGFAGSRHSARPVNPAEGYGRDRPTSNASRNVSFHFLHLFEDFPSASRTRSDHALEVGGSGPIDRVLERRLQSVNLRAILRRAPSEKPEGDLVGLNIDN